MGDSQVVLVHYLAHAVYELPREQHATCSADDDRGRDGVRSMSVGSFADPGVERIPAARTWRRRAPCDS
jgi:hypothetical protein